MSYKSLLKNHLFKSTAILTLAGLLSRFCGFFYRILIGNYLGTDSIGLIQMCTPIIALVIALTCSGLFTAISRFTALYASPRWGRLGINLCLLLSTIAAILLFCNSEFLAGHIFLDSRCTNIIKIMSFCLPFMAIHNSVNNFFFGYEKSVPPAISQIIEQFTRISTLCLFIFFLGDRPLTITLVLIGNILGELVACVYLAVCLLVMYFRKNIKKNSLRYSVKDAYSMIAFSIPLGFNHTLIRLFESGEAILIPASLTAFGLTNYEALSQFGILTGMAIPLIMFPSAAFNSYAVMLLPSVSKNSTKDVFMLRNTIRKTIEICLSLGIFSTFLFICFGARLGAILFNNETVYWYVRTLAWLCPFMYLKISLASILNGLGKTKTTCMVSITGILIRLISIVLIIPRTGILGYLISLLVSNIFISFFFLGILTKKYEVTIHPVDAIVFPLSSTVIASFFGILLHNAMSHTISKAGEFLPLLCGAILSCIIFVSLTIREQLGQH